MAADFGPSVTPRHLATVARLQKRPPRFGRAAAAVIGRLADRRAWAIVALGAAVVAWLDTPGPAPGARGAEPVTSDRAMPAAPRWWIAPGAAPDAPPRAASSLQLVDAQPDPTGADRSRALFMVGGKPMSVGIGDEVTAGFRLAAVTEGSVTLARGATRIEASVTRRPEASGVEPGSAQGEIGWSPGAQIAIDP